MTKLSSSLPAGDRNGLGAVSPALVRRPTDTHVVIAVIDCKRITTDYDTGDVIPTARIRMIEVVQADDYPMAEAMTRRAMSARSGPELPLDWSDEIATYFGDAPIDVTGLQVIYDRDGGDDQ